MEETAQAPRGMLLAAGGIAGPQTGELGVYAGCRWFGGARTLESLVEVCGCLEGQVESGRGCWAVLQTGVHVKQCMNKLVIPLQIRFNLQASIVYPVKVTSNQVVLVDSSSSSYQISNSNVEQST